MPVAEETITTRTPPRRAGSVAGRLRTVLLPVEGARRTILDREALYRRILVVADVFAAVCALIAALSVGDNARLTPQACLVIPLAIFVSKLQGLYDRDDTRLRKTTLDEAPKLFQTATLFALCAWLLQGQLFTGELGPKDVVGLWLVLFGGLLAFRATARWAARHIAAPERCMFIGEAGTADRLRAKLRREDVNAAIVGSLEPREVAAWSRAATDPAVLRHIRNLIDERDVHRVILSPHGFGPRGSLELVRTLKAVGVRVSLVPDLFEVLGSSVVFDDVHGLTVLGVRNFALSRSSRLIKRGFDLLAACTALLISAPVFALVSLLIRLDSRGSIFFRQERIGQGGRRFHIFKFRTMVADAEAQKEQLRDRNEGALGFFKIADDPRVTRVGRLLRRTSLDELPQLLNVVRGEMSLVGPRPLIAEEDQRVVGWHRRRLELTPGITGHWQVLGSSRVPLSEMVALDYLYVANWSLWSDAKLLLRTIPHVLGRRGI